MTDPNLVVELPKFIAKKENIPSLFVNIVRVISEKPRSFEVEIEPIFKQAFACWLCGRTIMNPKSIHWGVGPDCAQTLGLPYLDAPEDHPNLTTSFRKKLYISKGVLSEEQQANLRIYVKLKETVDVNMSASLSKEKDLLVLQAPFLNKMFVDELKKVEGRHWEMRRKVTTFPFSETNVNKVVAVLTNWNLLMSLDEDTSAALERYRKTNSHFDKKLKEFGVTQVEDLKEVTHDLDTYDWGLKTEPWQHQRQAIIFAATHMGITVPKKGKF